MKIIRKSMNGYWGMNNEASKELHSKYKPKPNEIYIDPTLHGRKYRQVVAHEEIEKYLMQHDKLRYKDADKVATRFEKNIR